MGATQQIFAVVVELQLESHSEMPNDSRKKSKYWCFTLNNPTAEEKAEVSALVDLEPVRGIPSVTFLCFGFEEGETGTPHLQGYLECKNRVRLSGIKKIAGLRRAHFEVRRGTQAEAIDYCQKDQAYVEYGTRAVGQGSRSDLEAIKVLIDEGKDDKALAEANFGSWCRNRDAFLDYRRLVYKKQARDVEVYVVWGLPGTGKTRMIFETYPEVWISNDPTLQWFDGYAGQEVVLIDDYRGDGKAAFVLRLCDRDWETIET